MWGCGRFCQEGLGEVRGSPSSTSTSSPTRKGSGYLSTLATEVPSTSDLHNSTQSIDTLTGVVTRDLVHLPKTSSEVPGSTNPEWNWI